MNANTWLNLGLVLLAVLIGGVFAATEIALVSLRESQLHGLRRRGPRGAKVAALARDPNTFLAAVQIGVTVAGFLSAAFGASTLAPSVAPVLVSAGLSVDGASVVSLIGVTLVIAFLSLVLGELVPKRLALQRAASFSLLLAPPLLVFARLMRPMIWLLSVSTNAVVRVLGGDPHVKKEEMPVEELRDLLGTHPGLAGAEREILDEVITATERTLREVMRPRTDVAFLKGSQAIPEAIAQSRATPHTRYPITGRSVDDVIGFVHVRDLLDPDARPGASTVADLARPIESLPGTNRVLTSLTQLRRAGVHIAVVIDEYGGTDGIVTLEDLVEEIVGEMRDDRDPTDAGGVVAGASPARLLDGSLNIEDFTELTGIALEDGPYETAAGYLIDRLGRLPVVGDAVHVGSYRLRVAEIEGLRVTAIEVVPGLSQ